VWYSKLDRSLTNGLIRRYQQFIPLDVNANIVSINEGDTPLIRLRSLSSHKLNITVYGKYEGSNPTGSFKDRGMTVAISNALAAGNRAIICASTGNTSASAAAYAARAGLVAFVLIPEGKIAVGKLAQAIAHGAHVIQINGNFDDGMMLVKDLAKTEQIAIVNSVNKYRLHGQKTAAFEIIDVLHRSPDFHYLPVGNAGNISAYWMGYQEYHLAGHSKNLPVMIGCQASGAAPFVRGEIVLEPDTIATAIRIGNPQSWDLAWEASQNSQGWFLECSDHEILAAQKLLAEQEGIFCEPASAASVAGLVADLANNKIPPDSTVVCTLTGAGLKDPDSALLNGPAPMSVSADLESVKRTILDNIS